MSLDGFVTRAIVHELQSLVGARIHKIYQPTEHEVLLHVRRQGVNRKLLLSAHPSMPRLHFTEQTWTNPQEPPMFCMLLRKHCEGGIVEAVRQSGLERVVEFDIRHRDELGDLSIKRLVLEIMGRHSNLILLDPASGTIHDSIHHVTPAISSYRVVLPGAAYVAPPSQHKQDPLNAEKAEFERLLSESPKPLAELTRQELANVLLNGYTGFSPLLAKEVVHRAEGDPAKLWDAFAALIGDAKQQRYAPASVETDNGKTAFSVFELTHLTGKVQSFATASECLDAFYKDKAERDLVRQRTTDLTRLLVNESAKNEKKLEKLRETLQEAEEADHYRKLGELLTAHLHAIRKGDASAEVIDYYDEKQPVVSIPLDPQLTPNENAQRYFRKYNKLKNSRAVVAEQIAATEEELRYLASVLQGLETATPSDIEEIREELQEQGYIRQRGAGKGERKKKQDRPALLCYTSSEGIPIFVGKNNTQNDYVTNRLGQPNDTWLHTKDIPGSHVLIRAAEYGERTLHEAAMLAAYYSKARESSGVPVDYTRIRHVRKPSGAKPGFVIYEGQRTLFVTPDEAAVKRLPCTVKQM
jgi:predicted ribosome quality control (RQC) complex YloA/Tae2 family protein